MIFFEKFQTAFVKLKPSIPPFGKQIVELCPLFMVKHRAWTKICRKFCINTFLFGNFY